MGEINRPFYVSGSSLFVCEIFLIPSQLMCLVIPYEMSLHSEVAVLLVTKENIPRLIFATKHQILHSLELPSYDAINVHANKLNMPFNIIYSC